MTVRPPEIPAVALRAVHKRYGRRVALNGLDLQVRWGTVTGLVGSNGAGKTTTMALLCGLLQADQGEISILGRAHFDPASMAGRVALLPQDASLPLHTPVAELLRFYAGLQGLSRAAAAAQVERVLDWVNLSDRARSPIRTLSHGMRRRVVIAQALLGDPELVLLDEPMSGLDPAEVINIRGLIGRRRKGQTVVVSSHNLNEIERICEYVIFIEHGRLVRQDMLDQVSDRHRVLTYTLSGMPPCLAGLAGTLPGLSVIQLNDPPRLQIEYNPATHSPAEVNRALLPPLLAAGTDILDISRGAGLEQAYLNARDGQPPSNSHRWSSAKTR